MIQPTLTGELPLTHQGGGEHGVLTFNEEKHKYSLDGVEIPGVTTILGVLDKPGLPWWGMSIGVAGVLHVIDQEGIEILDLEPDQIVKLLTRHKVTVNHVRDKAGDRGTAAHDQLERYGVHGTPLKPAAAPVEARGYIRSGAAFLAEMGPELLANEVAVWSPAHRFAGTFDAIARIDGELWLLDYKTSKRVYDTHHLQLAAYEGARRELGLEPIARQAVVHITPDGTFDPDVHFVEVVGTYEQFLAVKGADDAMRELKSTLKLKR